MANAFATTVFLAVLMLTSCNAYVECDVKPPQTSPYHFYGHANTAMSNELGKYNATQYECMQLCRKDARCLGFTYAADTQECATFDRDSVTGPEHMETVSGVWFYDMRRKKNNRSYVGRCQTSNRCFNGGSCVNDCSEQGYSCACPVQFHGKLCESGFIHDYEFKSNVVGISSASNTAFTYKNKHYLVIGGYMGISETPTKVYIYSNADDIYTYHQDLASTTSDIENFIINDQLYIFAAVYETYGVANAYIRDSYLYKLNIHTGLFEQHQTIVTQGVRSASYLQLAENHYLLVANYYGTSYEVDTEVYRWNFTSNLFVEYVQLPSHGAITGKLFSMDGALYAAIANYYGTTDGTAVKSQVWRVTRGARVYIGCFQDSGSRALSDAATSSSSMTIEYCINHCFNHGSPYAGVQSSSQCFCGTTYAKYSQRSESECSTICNGNSQQICGGSWRNSVYTTGRAELVQSLDESNAGSTGIDTFTNNGDTYLVVVNHHNCIQNTIVYIWDKSTDEFQIHQRIPVEHCPYRSTIFKVGGEVFMILTTLRTDYSGSVNVEHYTTSSPIFKLEGSMFVRYGAITSHECYFISFFERDGEYFLGQSNQRNADDGSKTDPSFNIYQWV
ncbi:uncharacterized protein [Antedon mediterranea]|uniref:uncharacterized protein n=1 Tax=Antedon mediterranea TaxID=105859 RepID=UPI003AF92018